MPPTKNSKVTSLIPDQIKWDTEGNGCEGVLVNSEMTSYKDQSRGRYTVRTVEGMKLFMGTFIIDQTMALVPIGTEFGIKYLGEEGTNSTNRIKKFDIYITEEGEEEPEAEEVKEPATK